MLRRFNEWPLASLDADAEDDERCQSPSVNVSSVDRPAGWSCTNGDDRRSSGTVSGVDWRERSLPAAGDGHQPALVTAVSDADIAQFIEQLRRQVIGDVSDDVTAERPTVDRQSTGAAGRAAGKSVHGRSRAAGARSGSTGAAALSARKVADGGGSAADVGRTLPRSVPNGQWVRATGGKCLRYPRTRGGRQYTARSCADCGSGGGGSDSGGGSSGGGSVSAGKLCSSSSSGLSSSVGQTLSAGAVAATAVSGGGGGATGDDATTTTTGDGGCVGVTVAADVDDDDLDELLGDCGLGASVAGVGASGGGAGVCQCTADSPNSCAHTNTPLYTTPTLKYPLRLDEPTAPAVAATPPDGASCNCASTELAAECATFAAHTPHTAPLRHSPDTPHLKRYLQTRAGRSCCSVLTAAATTTAAAPPAALQQPADWQQQLWRRAAERRERCRQLAERRQQRHLSQLDAQRQQQQQQQRLKQQQIRDQLNLMVERRQREEVRRKWRLSAVQQIQAQHERAVAFHRLCVLRRVFAALRSNCLQCRANWQRAVLFNCGRLQRLALTGWRHYCHLAAERSHQRARRWFSRQLLLRALHEWRLLVSERHKKDQAACDFYTLHLTLVAFSVWKRFHSLSQSQLAHRTQQACQLYNRLVCRRALNHWRRLPAVERNNRLIESRRNRLRRIVRELLPDFIPPAAAAAAVVPAQFST